MAIPFPLRNQKDFKLLDGLKGTFVFLNANGKQIILRIVDAQVETEGDKTVITGKSLD